MRVKIKICGITNCTDAMRALDAGADWLGFNFYPPSPRFIPAGDALRILRRLPGRVKAVGVFVNAPADGMVQLARDLNLSAIQLHGDETREQVRQLARRRKVIKAFRVRRGFRVSELARYKVASAFLLDGFSRKVRGGTGKTFDWSVARRARRYGRIFLAGGITPENVAEAVKEAQPYAIDVCSGVERTPGRKDPRRLRELGEVMEQNNRR